jgi:hypothetical protein
LRDEVLKKIKFFKKPRIIGLRRGYSESFREQAGVAGRSVPMHLLGELLNQQSGRSRNSSDVPKENARDKMNSSRAFRDLEVTC